MSFFGHRGALLWPINYLNVLGSFGGGTTFHDFALIPTRILECRCLSRGIDFIGRWLVDSPFFIQFSAAQNNRLVIRLIITYRWLYLPKICFVLTRELVYLPHYELPGCIINSHTHSHTGTDSKKTWIIILFRFIAFTWCILACVIYLNTHIPFEIHNITFE